jgi:CubicO group peptidase (beta-lactamase class C family)
MKKQLLIVALGLVFHVVTIAQQNNSTQLTAGFDKILAAQFKPDEPGVTALVAKKGQIIYQKAIGMANLELGVPMQIDNVFQDRLHHQTIYRRCHTAIDGRGKTAPAG